MKTKKIPKKKGLSNTSAQDLYSEQSPASGAGWNKGETLLFEPKTLIVIIITSAITLLFTYFGDRGVSFLTSVISPIPAHAPFDGTVTPVKQVPNWVKLTEAERKATYEQIPSTKLIPIPTYNASRLATPMANLKWGDAKDDQIRNEKITFSVPYMGSYTLDNIEGAGSHLAVDIKIPVNTPVFAIANGTVVKADTGNGGFGHHIVVQHTNVPSIDDPNTKTTYYSSYSHLSTVQVKVNDVVTKGQQIGLSGMTGTATTPHLHYQIDKDNVLWHPFWAFTSAEQNAAGYSFFQAINNGLGKEKALASTINPMDYVQKYYQGQLVASAPVVSDVPLVTVAPEQSYTFKVLLPGGTQYEKTSEVPFAIQAFDADGKMLSMPSFSDSVLITTKNNNGTLNKTTITAADLKVGMVGGLTYTPTNIGTDTIVVTFKDKQYTSSEVTIVKPVSLVNRLELTPNKSEVVIGDPVTVSITAFDADSQPVTTVTKIAGDTIALEVVPATASISMQSINVNSFVNGVATVTVTPTAAGTFTVSSLMGDVRFSSAAITAAEAPASTDDVATVQATDTAPVTTDTTLAADSSETNAALTQATFTDVSADSPLYTALSDLKTAGLISGYADGSYHPENAVTRAEAITFVLRVLSQEVKDEIKAIFPDVPEGQWFAKYVTTAFELGFVKGYPDGTFKPSVTVNLAEFSTMLFVAAGADIDPVVGILPNGVSASDWFAPYIQAGIKQGFLVVKDNTIDAAKPLTRGDVAEILYRLKNVVNQLKN